MKFLEVKFVLIYFLFLLNYSVGSTTTIEILPKAVDAIADYFSANCVYFLTSSSNDDFTNQRISKIMSQEAKKYFSFSNFSTYYNFLKKNKEGQCTVPLRIILHFKETNVVRDFKDFHAMYEDFSKQANAGLWIIFLNSFNEKFITKVFRDFYLPFDLEILCAWIVEDKVHFKELYQVVPSSSIRKTYFGFWALETGLISSQPSSRYYRRLDLEGLRLKVGYMENNMPFTKSCSTAAGHYLDGYFGKIWHVLEDLLNVSSTFIPIKIMRGKDENTNSWLILMKMLREKQIDVALGDFIPSNNRIDSFDFSYPLLLSNFQLYYQVTPDLSFNIYLLPFQTYVWIVLLNWWIFSAAFIFVTSFLTRRFSKTKEKKISPATYYFITFGGLCAQGSPLVPKSSSCRILFLLTYIVAAVMIPSYSANLTRYLTSESTGVFFENILDFYKIGTHEILIVDGSFEYYFFNFSRELNYFEKIFEQLKKKKLPKSHEEALHLLCRDRNMAFFTITSTFTWLQSKQSEHIQLMKECALRTMAQDAGIVMYSLIFPKNSRLKGIMDHHLKILQRTGIARKIENDFWITQDKIRKKNWRTVTLKESFGVFQIVACGVILSVVILILEQFLKRPFSTKIKRRKCRFRYLQFSKIEKTGKSNYNSILPSLSDKILFN